MKTWACGRCGCAAGDATAGLADSICDPEGGLRAVLVVEMPRQRSSMHLDTVFTFADDEPCVVFPPGPSWNPR